MKGINTSYTSPKVEMQNSPIHGRGLFAKEKILKDELIVDYEGSNGKFVNINEADRLYDLGNDYVIQVEDNLFFAATTGKEIELEDHINHSCSPTTGIKGKLALVACRDILPGEEITFDYAMSESSDYFINCHCGAKNCREIIKGTDWMIKDLQKRYFGYFSDYLQKKIENIT